MVVWIFGPNQVRLGLGNPPTRNSTRIFFFCLLSLLGNAFLVRHGIAQHSDGFGFSVIDGIMDIDTDFTPLVWAMHTFVGGDSI